MGLFSFLFDLMILSAGAAGVRRATGYSAKEFLLPKVSSPLAKSALSAYFGAGELVVTSGIKYAQVLKATREAKKDEEQKKD